MHRWLEAAEALPYPASLQRALSQAFGYSDPEAFKDEADKFSLLRQGKWTQAAPAMDQQRLLTTQKSCVIASQVCLTSQVRPCLLSTASATRSSQLVSLKGDRHSP
jgi:hypothetical protein